MEMKTNCITALLFLSFASISCSSDDSGSTPAPTPNPTPNPDGKVHYTTDVAPVINSNCTGCHSDPPTNNAPMPLTTLDAVKGAILTKGLIERISLPQGDPNMMPKNGTRLSQTAIDKIKKWQTDGFLN